MILDKELKEIHDLCVNCRLCLKECQFLMSLFGTRDDIVHDLESEGETTKTLYSCTICDLCGAICPSELNLGRSYLKLRQQKVEEGIGPLPVMKKFIDKDQERVLSDFFTLALPDTDVSECKRVFFPGCHLAGYSVPLVIKTYEYLKEKLPGTGILLGCCGAARREVGQDEAFREVLGMVESNMQELGASEIIVACPNCYYNFTEYEHPFRVTSVYEVLDEVGLPQIPAGDRQVFAIHDPCRARWEESMQDSVRSLLSGTGHMVSELQYSRELTLCCGQGGQIPFANLPLSKNMAKHRAEQADGDIVTYCASCRNALAPYKSTIHILDLIFNPDWEEAKLKPAEKPSEQRENQAELRAHLLERFGGALQKA